MEKAVICHATENNWKRLGVDKKTYLMRLSKRANKRCSTKNIIPIEQFFDIKNVDILNQILEFSDIYDTKTVIYNTALNFLLNKKIINIANNEILTDNKYLLEILRDFGTGIIDEELLAIQLPSNEPDFLGTVYQSLLKEGSKNITGSYYTPKSISRKILSKISDKKLFLDPCCGSGSFLLIASDKISNPSLLYGCDIDETACFIAKINLIAKYREKKFKPNIFNIDFLSQKEIFKDIKFDIVATNPPWGAKPEKKYEKLYPEINSKESFSYFIYAINKVLKRNGCCYLILPESILNVAAHKYIRKFILDKFCIKEIHTLGKAFAGVLSNVILLSMSKNKFPNVKIKSGNNSFEIPVNYYKKNINYNFSLINKKDAGILTKIYALKHDNLKNSKWALGVVTGNNKKYLLSRHVRKSEKIYTGKEITKYFLNDTSKYIIYDRNKFQQTADDSFYFAKEKLVYKFISKKLVFAYDNTSSLVLNSANILIPQVKTHSIKTVMAFLNSTLFQYVYSKRFGDIKILKSNLCDLPFPKLTLKKKSELEILVENYINTKNKKIFEEIDDFVYKCFKLSVTDIKRIKEDAR